MMSDVFIIGAGYSAPYGFPTGAMLMQKHVHSEVGALRGGPARKGSGCRVSDRSEGKTCPSQK